MTYYLLLASSITSTGWVLFYDRLLHYVMPPAFVLFWLLFVPSGGVGIASAAWVLVPPLVYAAYTFVRGPLTGFYPYPFVDVPELGIAPRRAMSSASLSSSSRWRSPLWRSTG